jgi:hypothetical protein
VSSQLCIANRPQSLWVNGEVGEDNSCIASNIAAVIPKFIEYGNLACIGRCARRFEPFLGVEIAGGSAGGIVLPIKAQRISSRPIAAKHSV